MDTTIIYEWTKYSSTSIAEIPCIRKANHFQSTTELKELNWLSSHLPCWLRDQDTITGSTK